MARDLNVEQLRKRIAGLVYGLNTLGDVFARTVVKLEAANAKIAELEDALGEEEAEAGG